MRLIDADALIESLAYCALTESPDEGHNYIADRMVTDHEMQYSVYLTILECVKVVDEQPTIEPKKGKWIPQLDKWGDIVTTVEGYKCSECNSWNTDKDNFCPYCGARMENE